MSNTPLNFKSNTRDSTAFLGPNSISAQVGWQDGTHEREDLPGYIGLGVSYFLIPGTLRLEPNLTVYETLERPMPKVLVDMELAGVKVDPDQLRQLSNDFAVRMGELEIEAHRLAIELTGVHKGLPEKPEGRKKAPGKPQKVSSSDVVTQMPLGDVRRHGQTRPETPGSPGQKQRGREIAKPTELPGQRAKTFDPEL